MQLPLRSTLLPSLPPSPHPDGEVSGPEVSGPMARQGGLSLSRARAARRGAHLSGSSRIIFAASTFAGESLFGAESIEMTETRIDST